MNSNEKPGTVWLKLNPYFAHPFLCFLKDILKGLVHDWWSLFTIFFYPNFIHQQSEAILKLDNHFQTYCTGDRAMRGIWRKRMLNFDSTNESYLSFAINLHYAMFMNIDVSWQCLQIKTLISVLSSVYCSILSKWFVHFWMTFCKNSIRISCKIFLCTNIGPNCEQVPFNISWWIYIGLGNMMFSII